MARIRLTPEPVDLEVYAGDANLMEIEIWAGGAPLDLSGAVITAQARKQSIDRVVVCEAIVERSSSSPSLLLVSWDGEKVRKVLNGRQRWRGVWDIQVLLPNTALPTTVGAGSWKAYMDVTRKAETYHG